MDREAWNKRKKQPYPSEAFVPKEGDPVTVSGGCASDGSRRMDEKCEHERRLDAVIAKRDELAKGGPMQATAAEYITDALLAPIEE